MFLELNRMKNYTINEILKVDTNIMRINVGQGRKLIERM